MGEELYEIRGPIFRPTATGIGYIKVYRAGQRIPRSQAVAEGILTPDTPRPEPRPVKERQRSVEARPATERAPKARGTRRRKR